jgi:tetratricopeptide (TPR) repeat protein
MTDGSDRIELWLKKANQNYDAGFLDRAEQEYDEVIRMDPNNLDAHYKRGLICYFEDNFDDAKKWFAKVIGIDPTFLDSQKDKDLVRKIKKLAEN